MGTLAPGGTVGGGRYDGGGTVANGAGIELVPRPLAAADAGMLGAGIRLFGTLDIGGTLLVDTDAGMDGM